MGEVKMAVLIGGASVAATALTVVGARMLYVWNSNRNARKAAQDNQKQVQAAQEVIRIRVATTLVSARNPLLLAERIEAYRFLEKLGRVGDAPHPGSDLTAFADAREAKQLYDAWARCARKDEPEALKALKALQDWWFSRGYDPGTLLGLGGHFETIRVGLLSEANVRAPRPKAHPLGERWRVISARVNE